MSVDLRLNWLSPGNRGFLRLLLDVLLLGGLLILTSQFKQLWGGTTQRGFFCDDETLKYPYKENTVTPQMLHWLSFYIPLGVLFLLETYRCWGTTFRPAYSTIRWFLFGHFAEQLLKNLGKQTIGRLRPHFFDVCRPQLEDGGFCSDVGHRLGGVYHTVYTCQTTISHATADMLRDVHVSFPSGHSSMAFYGLLFLALHLQRIRIACPLGATLLPHLCQLLLVGLASFIGLSRVMDYKHHWSDVVAGSLLGASVAFAVVRAAAEEQRLQWPVGQHVNAAPTGSSTTPATAAPTDAGQAQAQAQAEGQQQLPQDLCVVTCHSSN